MNDSSVAILAQGRALRGLGHHSTAIAAQFGPLRFAFFASVLAMARGYGQWYDYGAAEECPQLHPVWCAIVAAKSAISAAEIALQCFMCRPRGRCWEPYTGVWEPYARSAAAMTKKGGKETVTKHIAVRLRGQSAGRMAPEDVP